jgi:hypothetical protein
MGIVASVVVRQPDGKSCPLAKFTVNLYRSAVLFNDAVCYGQSKTGSTFPGGKKRIKNLTHIFLWNTFA